MRYRNSTHVRLSDDDYKRIGDAAAVWYRGNRTDLMRDAIIQHLNGLYAGVSHPSPLRPRTDSQSDATAIDESADIW